MSRVTAGKKLASLSLGVSTGPPGLCEVRAELRVQHFGQSRAREAQFEGHGRGCPCCSATILAVSPALVTTTPAWGGGWTGSGKARERPPPLPPGAARVGSPRPGEAGGTRRDPPPGRRPPAPRPPGHGRTSPALSCHPPLGLRHRGRGPDAVPARRSGPRPLRLQGRVPSSTSPRPVCARPRPHSTFLSLRYRGVVLCSRSSAASLSPFYPDAWELRLTQSLMSQTEASDTGPWRGGKPRLRGRPGPRPPCRPSSSGSCKRTPASGCRPGARLPGSEAPTGDLGTEAEGETPHPTTSP